MTEQQQNVTNIAAARDGNRDRATTANNALLVSVHISTWTARKHDKAVSREVARNHGAGAADQTGRYNKILMMDDALEAITKNGRDARAKHYEMSLAWDDNGNRVINGEGFFDWLAMMKEYKANHDALVPQFAANYPALVQEQRQRLNGLFHESDYPQNIADRFGFSFAMRKIEDAADFRCNLGADIEAQIRDDIEARVTDQWQAAQGELIERLVKTVSHITTRLTEYGEAQKDGRRTQFHASVTDNLAALVDCLPALNINGDARLAKICDEARAVLCKYPAEVLKNNESAREEIKTQAAATLATIQSIYQ